MKLYNYYIIYIAQKNWLKQSISTWLILSKHGNNLKNSVKNESNKLLYHFTDKLNLKNPNKNILSANLRMYYTWENIKSAYNNNKFKM